MKLPLLIIALLCSAPAFADEASKKAKIEKLVEAQGLKQMFDDQLAQSKIMSATIGKEMFNKLTSDGGVAAAENDPKFKKIFATYMERSSAMFTSKEMVDLWAKLYGKDLSEGDLDQIIAYYQSPVGKKDVRASQVAMVGYTQQLLAQSEKRMTALTQQMVKELDAAMKK